MAYLIQHNHPEVGYVSWQNLNMQYNGSSYAIADGYTDAIYVYWELADPYTLKASNEFPELTAADALVLLNKNGTAMLVPGATVLDGALIVPGTILAEALSANSVTGEKILAGEIDTAHLAAGAITADTIAAGAIGAAAIAAGAIAADHLSADAVTTGKIVSEAVTADKLAANSVTANKIAANAVTAAKIDAAAVTATKIDAEAVTADKLAANSVTADKINVGAVTAAKIDVDDLSAISGKFTNLMAGISSGAHVEIGAQSGLPFISMHDDAGNVITALTKEGIMIDPRGKINLPYLVSSNPDNAVIRTVNTVDRRYLMLRSGEGEENGAMIYVYNENDPTYPGQLRLYSGGSITAVLRTDNSVWFRGGVEVDGVLSTAAFRTNASGNLLIDGKIFAYGEALFDDEIRMRGNQPIRFPYYGYDKTPAGTLRVPRTSGRRYMIWDSHDGGAGARILLYSDSDSNTPGQIRLYPGDGKSLGLLVDSDRSARVYGDLRYDGGLYQGSTRGIPAADIQSGAVTRVKIANNAVNSTKTSGVTASTIQLREFGTAYTIELTFTNGLLTNYKRYL
jgi:hypothetical protein